jgi:hypothetical protein
MIEFQAKVSAVAETLLASLKGAPFCLPPPSYGVQLQRVLFDSVSFAHDQQTTATIFQHDPYRANEGTTIDVLQTQVVITGTIDFVRVQAIQDAPNQLVASEARLKADLTFDIDCVVSPADGNPVITRRSVRVHFDALTVTAQSLPDWLKAAINQWVASQFGNPNGPYANLIAMAEGWAAAQIASVLPPSSIPITLTSLLPPGAPFVNAGISIDQAQQCLCVRAEQLTSNSNIDVVWKNFLDGFFGSKLGANAWAVVMPAEDLRLTLQTRLWAALADAMGSERWRLITLAVSYSVPKPGVAMFTITPYFNVPVLSTQEVPMSIALSYDDVAGRLQVDVDCYGIRDKISEFEGILDTVLFILFPVVGIFAIVALHGAIADGELVANQAIGEAGGQALAGVDADAKFEVLPGLPFRYRASLPLVAPKSIPGRINELRADSTTVALGGSWGALHWRDADPTIEVSQFTWAPPKASCNTVGSAVADLRRNPTGVAFLYAEIALGSTGSMPIKLCSVDVLDDGGAPGGLRVTTTASTAPLVIEIGAASSFATLASKHAVRLNVRTSVGVFLAVLDPPEPITQQEIDFIAGALEVQRMDCERVLAPWFHHSGKFDVNWVVDPIHDPDPDLRPEIVRLEVNGLAAGARLTLGDDHKANRAEISLDGNGPSGFSTLFLPWQPKPFVQFQSDKPQANELGFEAGHGVQITRQTLEPVATIVLPQRARSVQAVPEVGPGRFAVLVEGSCLIVDASRRGSPCVERIWSTPGVRGIVSTRQGLWAWGPAGVSLLDENGQSVPLEGRARTAVLDAAKGAGWIVLLQPDFVLMCNDHGGEIAHMPMEDVHAIGFAGTAFVTASNRGLRVHKLEGRGRVDRGKALAEWGGVERLLSAPMTGSLFARRDDGRWTEILPDARIGATYADIPWETCTARAGKHLARLGSGATLEMYQALTPLQPALPRPASKPTRS